MRGTLTLLVLALGTCSSGCALVGSGVSIACTELTDSLDDVREHARNRRWAEAAWAQVAYDGHYHSEDYARGFKAGFAAHLFDGSTAPPPVPPAHYRRFSYQTPDGYLAIEQWFAGYRYGVSTAVATGYRRFVTGPAALPHGPVISYGPPPMPPIVHGNAPNAPPPTAIFLAPQIAVPQPEDDPTGPPTDATVPVQATLPTIRPTTEAPVGVEPEIRVPQFGAPRPVDD